MTLLAGVVIRSSVLLAIGLLLRASLARRSAALRHRVLAGAMLAAAAVLPVNLTLPEWTVRVPASMLDVSAPAPAVIEDLSATPPAVAVGRSAPRDHARPAPAFDTPSPLIVIWIAGVLAFGATLISSMLRVSRIALRASRIDDPRWLDTLQTIVGRYRLLRRVEMRRTDTATLVATYGIVRPRVLVPRDASDWTLDRVQAVIYHELAHVRRHDWLVQIGAEIVRALLWFNPLVWMACTRLRRDAEQACDDEVLGLGLAPRTYAAQLLELARNCRRFTTTWASAIPMAHPSTLERRIVAMLNSRIDRRPPSRRIVAALALALVLVTLPVALVRARQAPAPLVGTIYDVSGAVMPGVAVTLVDANENNWTAKSNASGRFELPAVGPGTYVLQVALAGFRTLRQEFTLQTARDWDRAITLQVGDLQETITVRSSRATPAEQTAAANQPVRVGGSIKPPQKVRDVRPIYPTTMREAGLSGQVPIEAMIGRDGTVTSVRVLSAQVHPDFATAAVDAVRQWLFTPTLLNGQAVEVVMRVSITFDLE